MQSEKITILNDLAELESVASFLENLAGKWDLGDEMLFNLNLVLEEVVTNIISYGYDDNRKDQPILLEMTLNEDHIRVKVTDTGREFNPLQVPPPDDLEKPAHDRKIGGLGVFLVRKLMDEVIYRYKDGKNVLELMKRLGQ